MKIKNVIVGELETNCYIVSNSGECLIIDPGAEADFIKKAVGELKVIGILITHHHFDHIGALEELKDFYHVSVYDYHNLIEGMMKIGTFEFEVIATPGHKEDSLSFLFDQKDMFVGDFIFQNSIGRTDLPGGDVEKMKESIQKIKTYSDEIQIYPGHGPVTNLGEEKKYNYFFR